MSTGVPAISVCCLAVAVLLAALSIGDVEGRKTPSGPSEDSAKLKHSWLKYKAKFGKKYDTEEEDQKRFKLWSANHAQTKEFRKSKGLKGLAKPNGKTAKPNAFADWTPEEKALLTGTLPPTKAQLDKMKRMERPLGFSEGDESPVPDFVDWRDSNRVTEVKAQGKCSSCWAFTVAAVMEAQRAAETGSLDSLSPQNIMDCTPDWAGCHIGHWYQDAFEHVIKAGVQSWNAYPYNEPNSKNDVCNAHDSPNLLQGFTDGAVMLLVLPGNEEELKRVVYRYGPVAVALHAKSDSFANYPQYTGDDGIYRDEPLCAEGTDHAVTIVGYGTDPTSGVDYWLIKNSWGTSWGLDGYMKIIRNANNYCDIASYAYYVLLDKPIGSIAPPPADDQCDGKACGCSTGFCWSIIDNIQYPDGTYGWCHTNELSAKANEVRNLQSCKKDNDCSKQMICTGCHRKNGAHHCPKSINGFRVSPGDCKNGQNEIAIKCDVGLQQCGAECNGDAACKGFVFSDDLEHPQNGCAENLCVTKNYGCTAEELFESKQPGLFFYIKDAKATTRQK